MIHQTPPSSRDCTLQSLSSEWDITTQLPKSMINQAQFLLIHLIQVLAFDSHTTELGNKLSLMNERQGQSIPGRYFTGQSFFPPVQPHTPYSKCFLIKRNYCIWEEMAIGQVLFLTGWRPSAGVTDVGFHLYLRRKGREVMCFVDSVCKAHCASNSRQKAASRGSRPIPLNIFQKKRKFGGTYFLHLFPSFFTPHSCLQKCWLVLVNEKLSFLPPVQGNTQLFPSMSFFHQSVSLLLA